VIDFLETILQCGFDPSQRKPKYRECVVVCCDNCGNKSKMQYRVFLNKKSLYCKKCPEYKNTRSEIAKKSNSSRPSISKNIQKYAKFLHPLKDGKITFTEIAKILDVDDSTVCKFYHKNFGVKSKFGGKSFEECEVESVLCRVLGDITRQVQYTGTKNRSDFFCASVGHIEYDGSGFWHIGKENCDNDIDQKFHPLRLNAQILFGKDDYLRWLLGIDNTGYCSVSLKDISKKYHVRSIEKTNAASQMLNQCHKLGNCAGTKVFGLFYCDDMIGVAKFGMPTNPSDNGCIELRRFFVLDGTPKNTESWFLRQCEKKLSGRLVTYIHAHENGSYLRALGWKQLPSKTKDYDFYKIGCKIYSKRVIWGWAKRKGLVDKLGTTLSKEILVSAVGGVKITEPSKIKFEKILKKIKSSHNRPEEQGEK